jgi:von Willebrand factor type A domain
MSDSNLTNPLAAILAAAANSISSKSSQEKVYQRTRSTWSTGSSFDIQLFDTSGSMASSIEDGTPKIDILANIFAQLPYCPNNYSFASDVRSIKYSTKLTAAGGTNLALALQTIASLNPSKILVVSDGVPDSTAAAFDAAAKLNCQISCFYIGLDRDIRAKEFLQKLAKDYQGKYEDCDISQLVERQQLPQRIQNLLPGN